MFWLPRIYEIRVQHIRAASAGFCMLLVGRHTNVVSTRFELDLMLAFGSGLAPPIYADCAEHLT